MKKFTLSIMFCAVLAVNGANAKNQSTSSVATFDDLSLASESHFPGNWLDSEDSIGFFNSGDYKFKTYSWSDYQTWAFFGYSNETATSYSSMDHQFRNVVGSGVDSSSNYSIVYASTYMGYTSVYHADSATKSIPGTYITNTAWVKEAIINGDATEDAFTTGDSLVLNVTGLIGDSIVGKASFFLADYRSADTTKHYFLDSWEWIDLSSIGDVEEMQFMISGSRNGVYGLNTPTYFAIDNFGAECPARVVDTISNNSGLDAIDLSNITSLDSANGNITYRIINTEAISASISQSTLSVVMTNMSGNITIEAKQGRNVDYITIPVVVVLPEGIADFENIMLADESHVPGNATLTEDGIRQFFSGDYKFVSRANSSWGSYSHFAVSNETSTEYASLDDQFRNVVGAGADESKTYAIAYIDSYAGATSIAHSNANADTIHGIYITNTAMVEADILKGSDIGGTTPFAQGDSLILTVYGILEGDTVNTIKINLADYRTADEHYYLSTWEWFDLSSLGAVEEIRFAMSGSQNHPEYGLNTPSYFALDNVGATCPERIVEEQELNNAKINLSELTDFDAADGAITYTIINHDANINTASINGAELNIAMTAENGSILVLASQRGKKDYMRIPVKNIPSNTINPNDEALVVWANNGVVNVECNEEYSVEIYSVSGVCLVNTKACQGISSFNVDTDIVMVHVITEANSSTTKVILK